MGRRGGEDGLSSSSVQLPSVAVEKGLGFGSVRLRSLAVEKGWAQAQSASSRGREVVSQTMYHLDDPAKGPPRWWSAHNSLPVKKE